MGIETAPESTKTIREIEESPEYQSQLRPCIEDAEKFAARVKEKAGGEPSEAEIQELRDEYMKISESTLISHDSLPDSMNNARSPRVTNYRIKGTDGAFMASVRIAMLEALGDGDYNAQTPARKLFEEKINPGMGFGLLSPRERVYR